MRVLAMFVVLLVDHLAVAKISDQDSIQRTLLNKSVYKKQERPDEVNTTDVMVYMKIIAIDSVDVRQMQYSIDVYLRQVWTDRRLAWSHIQEFKHVNNNIVSPSLKYRLWLPDLFFRNGKMGYIHNMTTPNFLMRVKSNGEVLYSQKITMVFSCQMELHAFPMDTQSCEINIGSYGYTLEELRFFWRQNDTIVVNKELKIPEFETPNNIKTIDCSLDSGTSTGNYTCLKAIIVFQRQLGSYLASTYIPSVLIIMVSWMNFWVSIDAVPARITLGLLSLLGILNQATSMSSTLPRVSYIKAIDVWLIACIVFVIAALLEFAIATAVASRHKARKWRNNVLNMVHEEIGQMHSNFSNNVAVLQQHQLNHQQQQQQQEPKQEQQQQKPQKGSVYSCSGGGGGNKLIGSGSLNRVGVMGVGARRSIQAAVCPMPPGMEMLFSNNPSQNEVLLRQLDRNSKLPITASLANVNAAAAAAATATKKKTSPDSYVDSYSRFLFPGCYFIFNIFYWIYYIRLNQTPDLDH